MNKELGVWTYEDCALVLIDYQNEMFEVIRSETDADLVDLYTAAGAKYLVALACHHDNFDNFASSNPWNAVTVGPKKDIIGTWKKRTTERGILSNPIAKCSSDLSVCAPQ